MPNSCIQKIVVFSGILILLVVISTLFFVNTSSLSGPKAHNGSLNLSNWNLNQQGSVLLNGQWKIKFDQFLEPPVNTDQLRLNIPVPRVWNKAYGKSHGIATYVLHITLHPDDVGSILGVKTSKINSAFKIFINNRLIGSNGVIGTHKNVAVPEYRPDVFPFESKSSNLTLLIQISNFNHRKGGIRTQIQFGKYKDLEQQRYLRLIFDLSLFGIIITMGFYHISLQKIRINDLSPVLFGIFCLIVAIRILINGDIPILMIWPDIHWEVLRKIEYITFFISIPMFAAYLYTLYPKIVHSFFPNCLVVLGTLFSIFTLFTPPGVFSHIMVYYHIITIISCVLAAYYLGSAHRNKSEGATLFLMCFGILFLTVINDILFENEIIKTMSLTPFGLFIFIFSQVYLLSTRFEDAFSKVEVLTRQVQSKSEELIRYGQQLEEMVIERTQDLQNSLLEANRDKEIYKQKNIEKTVLYASLNHELRAPMQGILGFAQLGKDKTDNLNKDKLQNYFSVIFENGHRLLSTVNEILDFTKFEMGKIKLNIQPQNLVSLAKIGINELNILAGEKKIKLIFTPENEEIIAAVDAEKLIKVIRNLLSNAIKFTPPEERIEIQLFKKEDNIIFQITDSGIGIPEAELETIFEKFTQSSNTQNFRNSTGLGLAIAKEIIEQHDGAIWAENNPEKGARLTFTLPEKQVCFS